MNKLSVCIVYTYPISINPQKAQLSATGSNRVALVAPRCKINIVIKLLISSVLGFGCAGCAGCTPKHTSAIFFLQNSQIPPFLTITKIYMCFVPVTAINHSPSNINNMIKNKTISIVIIVTFIISISLWKFIVQDNLENEAISLVLGIAIGYSIGEVLEDS